MWPREEAAHLKAGKECHYVTRTVRCKSREKGAGKTLVLEQQQQFER